MSRNHRLNRALARSLRQVVENLRQMREAEPHLGLASRVAASSACLTSSAEATAYVNAKVDRAKGLTRLGVFDAAMGFVEVCDRIALDRLADIRLWLSRPLAGAIHVSAMPQYEAAIAAVAATIPVLLRTGIHGDVPSTPDGAQQYFRMIQEARQGRGATWDSTSHLRQFIDNLPAMIVVLRVPDQVLWTASAENLIRWCNAHCAAMVARRLQPGLVPRRPRLEENLRRPAPAP